MQAGKWFLTTGLVLLGAGGTLAGVNIAVDLYGLYTPVHGRRLVVYGDPRVAKYLLNTHYVPENFNSVLIGPSVSANWDMTAIRQLRVYNDSLNAGNAMELKAVVESALSKPGIRVAFLLVHPALTDSHEYMTVSLTPRLRASSLGSMSLWEAYKDILKIRLHRSRLMFDYAGTEDFGEIPTVMNDRMKRMWKPGADFAVDPTALAAYRELVGELHAHQVRIVFVIPPAFEGLLEGKRAAFDKYARFIQAEMTAADKWIDFTAGPLTDLRRDRANFPDDVHLVPQAAQQVVSYLDASLNGWIEQNWLAAPQ